MARVSSHTPEKYMQRIRYLENCSATWASTPWMSSSLSTNQRRETDAVQAGREDAEAGRSLRVLSLSELQVLPRKMLRLSVAGSRASLKVLPLLCCLLLLVPCQWLRLMFSRYYHSEIRQASLGALNMGSFLLGLILWGQLL